MPSLPHLWVSICVLWIISLPTNTNPLPQTSDLSLDINPDISESSDSSGSSGASDSWEDLLTLAPLDDPIEMTTMPAEEVPAPETPATTAPFYLTQKVLKKWICGGGKRAYCCPWAQIRPGVGACEICKCLILPQKTDENFASQD